MKTGEYFFAYADYADEMSPIGAFTQGFKVKLLIEEKSKDGELNKVYLLTAK